MNENLTKREKQIFALIAEAKSNGEIAQEIGITEDTVQVHLSNLYKKLNVSGRIPAALLVLKAERDKLKKVKSFVEFYFTEWGEAKATAWEHLTNDALFNDESAMLYLQKMLKE